MLKDKTAPSPRIKNADERSKTPQVSGHREDIEAAPLRLTGIETAEGDFYRQLERLGAPSANAVALAAFRKLSVEHFTRRVSTPLLWHW